MSDPLDAVFVTGDEAAELKRTDTARKLATYLERMPVELRGLFSEQFQHTSSTQDEMMATWTEIAERRDAERTQLHEHIAELGAAVIERNAIIAEQARQLEQAQILISAVAYGSWSPDAVRPEYRVWLAANATAPQTQPAQVAEDE